MRGVRSRICAVGVCLVLSGAGAIGSTGESEGATSLLVSVGDWPVYSEDLEQVLIEMHSGVLGASRGAPDVDALIRRRLVADALLAGEAASIGMAEEGTIPEAVTELVEERAKTLLLEHEVEGRARVTEEEVRSVFTSEFSLVSFHRAVFGSQKDAERFRSKVAKGGDFASLARETAADELGKAGGRIEDRPLLELAPSILRVVVDSEPGQVLPPLESEEGWVVFRLDSIVEASEETFEQEREGIRRNLEATRRRELREALLAGLEERHEATIDDDAVASIDCQPDANGRFRPIVAEPELIVARVAGREIDASRLGRALSERWRSVTSAEAARATTPLVLGEEIAEEMLVAEAFARGLDEAPAVQRAAHALLTRLLVKAYISNVLAPSIAVDQREVEEYYEEHRNEFRRPPRLRIGQISLSTAEEAEEVADLLRAGADLAWLARQRSVDGFRDRGGDRGWVTAGLPLPPFTGVELRTTAEGTVFGPREMNEQFVVARINAVEEQGVAALAEVFSRARQRVEEEKFRGQLERNINALYGETEIVFHEQNIEDLAIDATGQDGEAAGARHH